MISAPPPPRKLRIAILEADHPLPNIATKFGTYGAIFSRLLTAAASTLGWDPSSTLLFSKFNVEQHLEFPASLDDIDAILITGGRADSFADVEWINELVAFVKKVLETDGRVRVVGVCFGHQVLARALGVDVARGDKWEVSVLPVELSRVGKEVFGKEKLDIFQMHRDEVKALPAGAENLGASGGCPIQGLYRKDRYISVQGHPEFNEEIVRELLLTRREAGVFTKEQYEDGISRVQRTHDGLLVAGAFLRFVADGVVEEVLEDEEDVEPVEEEIDE